MTVPLRPILVFGGLAMLAAAFAILDLMTGPAALSPTRVIGALVGVATASDQVIVRELRLPVAVAALFIGASLGLAGAVMQTVLDNPLASPFTMGLSAAAGVGATAMIVHGPAFAAFSLAATLSAPAGAFVTTLTAAFMIDAIGRWRSMTREVMVLAGLAIMFLCQSVQALIQLAASPDALPRIVTWFLGDLQRANWTAAMISGGALALCGPLLLRDCWRLTALRLGDYRAEALGVKTATLKRRSLVAVALLTAGAVSFIGTVGFVGLVAPHLARPLVGEDHRFLLPAAALTGATLLAAASAASKVIIPGIALPVTIVTSLVGVPFLFLLMHQAGRRGT